MLLLFLCISQRSQMAFTSLSECPPPTVCSPWRPQNPLGWLLAMLQDPAGTKQGALTPLFCGTQAVSNVRAGFSLWSWKHRQSLSQSLAEHILGKGNTWREMKWRILGTWAHGVSLSASFDGISVFLECIHLEWGWKCCYLNIRFKHILVSSLNTSFKKLKLSVVSLKA